MMKILIAEDNLFYRLALESTLQEWGYEVVAVSEGNAAFEKLSAEHAPLIGILDWVMPGMDGLEVCRRVRALQKHEPPYLIVLTAKEGKENIVTALESGADDYVTKPFNREELKARLRVARRIVGLQRGQTLVYAFARAVEAKSPYTQGHADRVAGYALALADVFDVPSAEKDILRRGAILHDIGKIAIPDVILNKTGPLTEEELHIIQQHPMEGVKIIEQFESMQDVIPMIRWHHERHDGCGYPDGVRAAELPLLVRLLSVADVYDALASARPYRAAMPHEECLCLLRHDAEQGGLSVELVDAFCRLPFPSLQRAAATSTASRRCKIVRIPKPGSRQGDLHRAST